MRAAVSKAPLWGRQILEEGRELEEHAINVANLGRGVTEISHGLYIHSQFYMLVTELANTETCSLHCVSE